MITATSNGVNLTDGLDGLATGAAVMSFAAFILIGVWEFGQSCAITTGSKCYEVRDPLDLAVLAAALAAACTGFLWWNTSPAKIFMGDTGSLALGGLLGSIAVAVKHEIVLAIVGGLFVLEALRAARPSYARSLQEGLFGSFPPDYDLTNVSPYREVWRAQTRWREAWGMR